MPGVKKQFSRNHDSREVKPGCRFRNMRKTVKLTVIETLQLYPFTPPPVLIHDTLMP